MSKENQTFQVGDFTFENPLILAPMDGYSSWPFRSLCRELGSEISYTEFVKAEDVIERPPPSLEGGYNPAFKLTLKGSG